MCVLLKLCKRARLARTDLKGVLLHTKCIAIAHCANCGRTGLQKKRCGARTAFRISIGHTHAHMVKPLVFCCPSKMDKITYSRSSQTQRKTRSQPQRKTTSSFRLQHVRSFVRRVLRSVFPDVATISQNLPELNSINKQKLRVSSRVRYRILHEYFAVSDGKQRHSFTHR